MLSDLHRLLAFAAIAFFVLAAATAAVSALRSRPDRSAVAVDAGALLAVALAAILGLGLLVVGKAPREILHYVYAVVAFVAIPAADLVALGWTDRRRGIARFVGAVVGIAVVIRSFATG